MSDECSTIPIPCKQELRVPTLQVNHAVHMGNEYRHWQSRIEGIRPGVSFITLTRVGSVYLALEWPTEKPVSAKSQGNTQDM